MDDVTKGGLCARIHGCVARDFFGGEGVLLHLVEFHIVNGEVGGSVYSYGAEAKILAVRGDSLHIGRHLFVFVLVDGRGIEQRVHAVERGCGASPNLEQELAIGDGPQREAIPYAFDEIHGHIHPRLFGVAEGVPVAGVGEAVVIFLKIAAKPAIVVAVPANRLLKVMVGIFEAFSEQVTSEGNGCYKTG